MFKNYRFAWKILRFLPCFLCVMFARFVDKTSYYFCKKGNKCIIQFVLQTQLFKRICFIYSWWNSQLIFIIALVTLFDWSPFYFSCCVQFILTEKKKPFSLNDMNSLFICWIFVQFAFFYILMWKWMWEKKTYWK